MRKTALYILTFTMLLALAGCAGQIRKSELNSIKSGMTKEQVVQILGKPKNITSLGPGDLAIYGESEIYRYYVYKPPFPLSSGGFSGDFVNDNYDLYFKNGKYIGYRFAGEETIYSVPYRFDPVFPGGFRPGGRRP